ncbi:hypothetical protein K432DRAFT_392714 [Lepidopterella palustris CBS 459.81]|uniref:Myb-like DNA-binding domain-containing protein n=1 Tax=Lepidopterella palustris CBS 459.81 TaxID=1314670 RepID=A0A8E2JFK3_9PEZI|nr:hypothetical protein K432DRAFT_392714 [Lepidopterella palustris CBS 459.81]
MPTDKEMILFCFSMLKQLDLKHLNWKLIAEENSITNAQAAGMRYHRFQKQMDKSLDAAASKDRHATNTKASKRKRDARSKKKIDDQMGYSADVSDDSELELRRAPKILMHPKLDPDKSKEVKPTGLKWEEDGYKKYLRQTNNTLVKVEIREESDSECIRGEIKDLCRRSLSPTCEKVKNDPVEQPFEVEMMGVSLEEMGIFE